MLLMRVTPLTHHRLCQQKYEEKHGSMLMLGYVLGDLLGTAAGISSGLPPNVLSTARAGLKALCR